jgi:hypothetical protein
MNIEELLPRAARSAFHNQFINDLGQILFVLHIKYKTPGEITDRLAFIRAEQWVLSAEIRGVVISYTNYEAIVEVEMQLANANGEWALPTHLDRRKQ